MVAIIKRRKLEKVLSWWFKRTASIFVMAFILGISNVILEDTGMVKQCREPMELQHKKKDVDALGNKHLW